MLEFLSSYGYIIFTVLLVPVFILAIYAQSKVTSTFNTFKRIDTANGKTASQVATEMLENAGIKGYKVVKISGQLTDNFNPKNKTVSLSEDVYNSTSVASIGVAAHEVGHAIQYNTGYFPIKLRTATIHISNFASKMLLPLIIIGFIMDIFIATIPIGLIFMMVSIGIYALSFFVNLATLPVEFNASNRALKILETTGTLNATELPQAKRVLSSASLTYVASTLMALVQFLRIIFYFVGISKDD